LSLEIASKLPEVIDLSIKNKAIAPVGSKHRLVRTGIEVENGKPPMAKDDTIVTPEPLRIGSSRNHAMRHSPNRVYIVLVNSIRRRNEPCNTAHLGVYLGSTVIRSQSIED
jgi:hypothetical protein